MSKSNQTKDALKRFEFENQVEEQKVYHFTEEDIQAKLRSKYWRADPETFKKVKISAVALIKMTMHARSGGDIEVMGLMQGYPDGDTIWVMDVFGLPVEACETRVNAGKEADGFMIEHFDQSEKVDRPENCVGWYHSHPGYGCWLSGIDVNTQQSMQMVQDPCIAIVVDPMRTMSAGKVELGCFRTFTNEVAEKRQNKQGGMAAIPEDKIADFGLHGHKYYQIEHSFFKSELDTSVIDQMWNEYWVHTLASSPLITNENFTAASIIQIVKKMNEISSGNFGQAANDKRKKGGRGGGNFNVSSGGRDKLEMEKYNPIEKESSKVAVSMQTGVLMEFLKKFMFAYQQGACVAGQKASK